MINENNETIDHTRTVYVDMDGVIADFDKGIENITGKRPDVLTKDDMWKAIERHGRVRFFADLPWMDGGEEMWMFIVNNFLNVKILTALGKQDLVDGKNTKGKRAWLQRNIPSLSDSDIIMVANKHKKRHYSKSGDIIIDDREVVVDEWNKNGGIGLLYKTASETIERLKKYV